MKGGRRRCRECGRVQESPVRIEGTLRESCLECGGPLDSAGLSEFASRLARFGLGDTRRPLLGGLPEAPHAD